MSTYDLCENELHLTDGRCLSCRNIRRRRSRAAIAGRPLCWTATHPEPMAGEVCACGEPPPEPTWTDWVLVDRAVKGIALHRRLTAGEQLCALKTAVAMYGGGLYDAASVITDQGSATITNRRVVYLTEEWPLRDEFEPLTVNELVHQECEKATAPVMETAA